MNDYASKFTNKVILESIKKWKSLLEDNDQTIDTQIALANSQAKETM